MRALLLVVLRCNENGDRLQAITKKGKPCYSIHFPNYKKGNTINSENKPRGLYLSKALFEGLIYRGKFAFQNRLGLYLEGNLCQ